MAPNNSTPTTYNDMFTALLQRLGIKPTPGALAGLADVVHEEGPNDYFNPFNIEWHKGQSTAWEGTGSFNSVGVQKYSSAQAGVNATARFLLANPRYAGLLSALKSGSTSNVQQAFVKEYTWAPFHTAPANTEQAILKLPIETPGSTTPNESFLTRLGIDLSPLGQPAPGSTLQKNLVTTGNAAQSGISSLEATTKFMSKLTDASTWKRIGLGTAGAAMLVIGLVMILKTDVKLPGGVSL